MICNDGGFLGSYKKYISELKFKALELHDSVSCSLRHSNRSESASRHVLDTAAMGCKKE
jgi:hypothetical protein